MRFKNKKRLLKEAVQVEGADYIGSASFAHIINCDLFKINTYEAAQQFRVNQQPAGAKFCQNEQTFNHELNDPTHKKLYFFTDFNTNQVTGAVLIGFNAHPICLKSSSGITISIPVPFMYESINGDNEVNINDNICLPLLDLDNQDLRHNSYNGTGAIINDSRDTLLGIALQFMDPDFFDEYNLNLEHLTTEAFSNILFSDGGVGRCAFQRNNEIIISRNAFNYSFTPSVLDIPNAKITFKTDSLTGISYVNVPTQQFNDLDNEYDENFASGSTINYDYDLTDEEREEHQRQEEERLNAEQADKEEAERLRSERERNALWYEKTKRGIKILGVDHRIFNNDNITLVIPNEIEGKPVTIIGSYAFYHVINLNTITLPSTIQLIEKNAFGRTLYNILISYNNGSEVSVTDNYANIRRILLTNNCIVGKNNDCITNILKK